MPTLSISSWPMGRRSFIGLFSGALVLGSILLLWYGVNSDKDDVSPIITQLIPAGNCACETSTKFECSSCLGYPNKIYSEGGCGNDWRYDYAHDAKNLTFTEQQCWAAFPGLFEDVEHGKQAWDQHKITRGTLDKHALVDGTARAMIVDGDLYVIAARAKDEDHRRKILAALSSMYRALTASPERDLIENIEFIFSVEDKGEDTDASGHPLWVLARKATEHFWLMPDFGYWAWNNVVDDVTHQIGSFDELVERAVDRERKLRFELKTPKLVWRGKLSLAPKLRRNLLEQARGHDWADVKELDWDEKNNYLTLDEHCKYQFVAHAEGRSYSASLKYRQACRSVPVIHKLQYIQHHHYLLVSEGPLQNYIEVERDFSDLATKMSNILEHPEKGDKIAQNNVKTFRERYLTPAAEACYWRELWKGYGEVSDRPWPYKDEDRKAKIKRGLRYESFMLLSSNEMLDFKA